MWAGWVSSSAAADLSGCSGRTVIHGALWQERKPRLIPTRRLDLPSKYGSCSLSSGHRPPRRPSLRLSFSPPVTVSHPLHQSDERWITCRKETASRVKCSLWVWKENCEVLTLCTHPLMLCHRIYMGKHTERQLDHKKVAPKSSIHRSGTSRLEPDWVSWVPQ